MNLSVIIPTWSKKRADISIKLMQRHQTGQPEYVVLSSEDVGRFGAVDGMLRAGTMATNDVLMYLHDDVDIIEDGWDSQILDFLAGHPKVGLAGFCGALGLGTDDIYKSPYRLQQLARINFYSNTPDWQTHGFKLEEPMRVSVLDGLCQIFPKKVYEQIGTWYDAFQNGITFHMYDAWAACRMAEIGWEVWALPIKYVHHGGLTSTSGDYDKWLRGRGVDGDSEIHRRAHPIIYERFRGVLPLRV